MKKTISVNLGNEDFVIALMKYIGFSEVDRVSCGGTMSTEKLQLTFEGKEEDYQDDCYVEVKTPNNRKSTFYSINRPDGITMETIQEFKQYHYQGKMEIEIKTFKDE